MKDALYHAAANAPQEVIAHRAVLLKPPKKAAAWKPLAARLDAIAHLARPQGLGLSGGGGRHGGSTATALDVGEVMACTGAALGHAHAAVRGAAVRIVVLCFASNVRLHPVPTELGLPHVPCVSQ